MSVKIMGAIWEMDLEHPEAWVLMAMADHADHDGRNVFPAIPLIAWKTGYTERSVQRIIKKLVASGVLEATLVRAGKPTIYRINADVVAKKAPLVRRQRGDKMTPVILSGVTSHGNDKTQGGDMASRVLLRNHQEIKEPSKDIVDEISPPETEQASTAPQPKGDSWNDLIEAAEFAMKLDQNYKMAARYAAFLGGTVKPKDSTGRKNGEWYEWQMQPGMSATEIRAFGLWMREKHSDIALVRKADKVADWAYQFRADTEYFNFCAKADRQRQRLTEDVENVNLTYSEGAAPQLLSPEEQAERMRWLMDSFGEIAK